MKLEWTEQSIEAFHNHNSFSENWDICYIEYFRHTSKHKYNL